MTWQKFDDMFAEHRKIDPLSDQAFRLYVSAGNYCCRALTDGYLSMRKAQELASRYDQPDAVMDELFRVMPGEQYPLWEQTPDGRVKIHDFEHYNPTRAEVEIRRVQNAERQSRFRDRHRGASNGVTNALDDASLTHLVRDPLPVPLPVPVPSPLPAASARTHEGESESRPEDAAPSSYSTQIVLEQILAILPPDARRRSELDRLARAIETYPDADYVGAAKDAREYGQSLIDAGDPVRSWARLYVTTLERWHAEGRTEQVPGGGAVPEVSVFGDYPNAAQVWGRMVYVTEGLERQDVRSLMALADVARIESNVLVITAPDAATHHRLEDLMPRLEETLDEGASLRIEPPSPPAT